MLRKADGVTSFEKSNIVFFHFTPQGGAVDMEGSGGFAFIPVVFSQRIKNDGFLAKFNFFVKCSLRFNRRRLGDVALERKGQMVSFDDLILTDNQCMLNNVFQFPDVSGIIVV